MAGSTSRPLEVVLKRGRSKPFWLGHPWVFSGAIHRVDGPVGDTGAACIVRDDRGNALGTGFYNPHARIAVRMLQHRRSTDLPFEPMELEPLLATRLADAAMRRAALGLPSTETTAYRAVNSEGDGLSGLVVDHFGDAAVVQLGSRQMYEARDLLVRLVSEVLEVSRVVVRVGEESSRLEAIPVMHEVHAGVGAILDESPVVVLEHGVRFELSLQSGQKTGFYCDQRDTRRAFAATCAGKSVLDAYSFVGAFGLHAAAAGATDVTSVDSSGPAIEAATRNAALNASGGRVTQVQGDAMTFLKEAQAKRRRWDRIVVDPPKFARGRSHVDDALKKYAKLNTLAMGCLAPGGLLLSCSCSQHIGEQDFLRMLTEAGHRLRKGVQVHAVWSQGADHPFAVVAPEGKYLKAALVSVG